jgi:TM2 domain-containing membrane protein YozV
MSLMGTYLPTRPTKFCLACNRIIDAEAVVCTSCGVMQPLPDNMATEKRILPAGLLCFFLGIFGAHRFYVGKIGTGLLQLVTLGGLGIWWLVDLIMLVSGEFRDKEGNRITEWT